MGELHPPPNNITTELPPDIILFHILPRLPAKSLLRFMCICKRWHSFLTTPTFAKMHLHHVNHHKLLVLYTPRSTTPYNFRTIDCEAPEDGLTASRSLPFKASGENMKILASLNGLVCVGILKCPGDDEYSDLILWNILMGDYKTLSKPNSNIKCYRARFGLYYSSCDDDYRLLHITHDRNAYIYSLKFDSWRKVNSTQDFQRIPYWISESALLNEKLDFLKEVREGSIRPQSYSISFGNTSRIEFSNSTVVSGCTHLCVTYANSRKQRYTIELWRMDGDGDHLSAKVETYYPKPSFTPPPHLTRNESWLMYSLHDGCLYKVDPKKHTQDKLCSYDEDSMSIPQGAKYMETFVSPNRYYIN